METDGVMEIFDSGYMFELESSPEQERILRVAGVFRIEQEVQSQFVLYDSHQLEIWQDAVTVSPNTLSYRSLLLEDLLQTVFIQVVEPGGAPIAGAHVATRNDGFLDYKNQTNGEGRATLIVSKLAAFQVHVSMEGFVSQSLAWPFAADSAIQLEPARSLRLQVLDSAGARVAVSVVLSDGTSQWHGNTQIDGVFQFQAIPQRRLRARIQSGATVVDYEVPARVETFTLTQPF
jgi:hypothetical protein